jgi:hypothetical protein
VVDPSMSPYVVILDLVLYPSLHVLRINPIRFQWGLKNGLAPVPPEFEERAQAGDRALLFIAEICLRRVRLLTL